MKELTIYDILPYNRPYVTKLSAIVFNLAVKLKLVRPWGPSNDIESGHVNTRAEAERRRWVSGLGHDAAWVSSDVRYLLVLSIQQSTCPESTRSTISEQASFVKQDERFRTFISRTKWNIIIFTSSSSRQECSRRIIRRCYVRCCR